MEFTVANYPQTSAQGAGGRLGRWIYWLLPAIASMQFVGFTPSVHAQPPNYERRGPLSYRLTLRDGVIAGASFISSGYFTPEQLVEQLVFREYGSADAARRKLRGFLVAEIDEIDRVCSLSPDQKSKLMLAGRGDIKRFFDKYYALKQDPLIIEQSETFVDKHRARDLSFSEYGELAGRTACLWTILQGNLHGSGSLLNNSAANALDQRQLFRYEELIRSRLEANHEATIQNLIRVLERDEPLGGLRREQISAFLRNEIKPSTNDGPFGLYYLLIQMGRLPQDKLQPHFANVSAQIPRSLWVWTSDLEPMLEAAGYFPQINER
jgi:hypothetical protein